MGELSPQEYLWIIFFVCTILAAVLVNYVVVVVVLEQRRLRHLPMYAFVLNLSLVSQVALLLYVDFKVYSVVYSRWLFGDVFCKFNHFFGALAFRVRVLTFLAIAIHVYFSITRPKWTFFKTREFSCVILTTIWLFSMATAIPSFFFYRTQSIGATPQNATVPPKNATVAPLAATTPVLCRPDMNEPKLFYAFGPPLSLFFYVLTFTFIGLIFTDGRMKEFIAEIRTLPDDEKSVEDCDESCFEECEEKAENRVYVKMLTISSVTFGLCLLPMLVYAVADLIFVDEWLDKIVGRNFYLLVFWFETSNFLFVPITFSTISEELRKGSRADHQDHFVRSKS